jgi:4-amino-4-deoxy-L-arabinose transferase-like glycosyltransferase
MVTATPTLPARLARRIPLPLAGWPLAALAAAFLLPGLFGHDPWKTTDAVAFGVVHQMLESGNWLLPGLAGEPYYDGGPLYFWIAALAVKTFVGLLPPHDAARIASALFIVIALWFVRLAARELYGKQQGDLSMIALMGCLGLMWHAHETAPETAMLAGLAAAYYGVSISHRKPVKGGLVFGVGTGVAFLSHGVDALLQPLVAALLVLPLCASFRQRTFGFAVALGLAVLLPFLLVWPWLVVERSPGYFQAWLDWQLTSVTNAPRPKEFLDTLKTLAWAAWPVWPMTLWATWEYRRLLREPGFAVPFVGMFVSLALLLFMADPREMDVFALLVPLAIPAGPAAMALRRGAANALMWFSMMTFTLGAGFIWVMWLATFAGFPEALARRAERLLPGFVFQVHWLPLAVALLLTAGSLVLAFRAERSTLRSLTYWASGVTLIWGLAMTLWLEWIDFGKSYRPVAESLREALPARPRCIESRALGESQRAVFHYHGGILTQRVEVHGRTDCPYLLVQSSTRDPEVAPGPRWRRVWEGSRPRDHERYRLYRRS